MKNVDLLLMSNHFILIGSSSTEDSSSSSSSENEAESESSNIIESAPKILTEQELNELGAKMVKAELMGNEVC